MEDTFSKIIALIEHKMGKYKKLITSDTALEADLGITGDDAVELLLEFSKKFNVDLSDFEIKKYFHPEGDIMLSSIITEIKGKKISKQSELKIKHLEKGIIAGKLDEEVINS